ncbi:hypothetical protein SAMN04515692_10526 [Leifsonia sp. CL147]|nr:hypothetical protein SAMN04515694_10527 [Leifsonia sp. CL154]SFL46507.1 hypothetical protein SAMN04515692_10526 [Leifsonia sp. CL147]
MKRRHVYIGTSAVTVAFLTIAVLRLVLGNGLIWHFLR